jgi:hypothetical protein
VYQSRARDLRKSDFKRQGIRIGTLLSQIDLGSIVLPEVELAHVWNRDQVRGLRFALYCRGALIRHGFSGDTDVRLGFLVGTSDGWTRRSSRPEISFDTQHFRARKAPSRTAGALWSEG